jgi:HKD family nuclease
LNTAITADSCQRFRFAVAYMRVSGLERLSVSIETLLNRGGRVSGAVGIDEGMTTLEALQMLQQVSADSTVFHTVSGYIYHPKLYLINGDTSAVAIVDSANLTRDGLFRNVELATVVHLDFSLGADFEVYKRYDAFLNALLDAANSNVQPINAATLERLVQAGAFESETQAREPGPAVRSRRARHSPPTDLENLFPPLRVPVAPPAGKVSPSPQWPPKARDTVIVPPTTIGIADTFILQLSAFDCSHRTGIQGTPEVFIPRAAIDFFPPLALTRRKYPDVVFDVILNVPTGREQHQYRLWYYEQRAVGTRIDEYRLRLDHDTIDMTTPGGGDLLIVNKLPSGSNPAYEVTILSQNDSTFPAFLALCKYEAQGKKWGET